HHVAAVAAGGRGQGLLPREQQHLVGGGEGVLRVRGGGGLRAGPREDRVLVEVDGQDRVLDAGRAQRRAAPRGGGGEQQQRIVARGVDGPLVGGGRSGHRSASSRTDSGRPPSSRARRWKSRAGVPAVSASSRSPSQTR